MTDHQISDRITGARFTAVRIQRRIVLQNPRVKHVSDKQVTRGIHGQSAGPSIRYAQIRRCSGSSRIRPTSQEASEAVVLTKDQIGGGITRRTGDAGSTSTRGFRVQIQQNPVVAGISDEQVSLSIRGQPGRVAEVVGSLASVARSCIPWNCCWNLCSRR